MKTSNIIFLLLCITLIISGCTSVKNEMTVYEMVSFSVVKAESERKVTDIETIATVSKLFKGASKRPGVANMADPPYKVVLGDSSYFLWIQEDSGTIMNVEDTHTTFALSKPSAAKIYEIITRLYNPVLNEEAANEPY